MYWFCFGKLGYLLLKNLQKLQKLRIYICRWLRPNSFIFKEGEIISVTLECNIKLVCKHLNRYRKTCRCYRYFVKFLYWWQSFRICKWQRQRQWEVDHQKQCLQQCNSTEHCLISVLVPTQCLLRGPTVGDSRRSVPGGNKWVK